MKKNNKGFSLVELIVVIAIMAILAAVAIVSFSLYIPKAQQAGDRQTVNDIIDAVELYYYSNPEMEKGYIKLTQNGAEADATGAAVMEAIYGSDWATKVSLQYANWQGATAQVDYANSSFAGKESSLLNEVDRLTGALGSAIEGNTDLIGENFNEFLGGYGMNAESDPNAIGNAAVLYVAQNTAKEAEFVKTTFANNINAEKGADLNTTFFALKDKIGSASALAAIYAYAEGFAQHCDQQNPELGAVAKFHEDADFGETTDADAALSKITTAFDNLANMVDEEAKLSYVAANGPGQANVAGYVGIMGTVNENKSVVEGNLGADDCFTDGTVSSLLQGYTEMGKMNVTTENGEIAVVFVVVDGAVNTYVYPLNWEE